MNVFVLSRWADDHAETEVIYMTLKEAMDEGDRQLARTHNYMSLIEEWEIGADRPNNNWQKSNKDQDWVKF